MESHSSLQCQQGFQPVDEMSHWGYAPKVQIGGTDGTVLDPSSRDMHNDWMMRVQRQYVGTCIARQIFRREIYKQTIFLET
jgi:hypothetical protein